MTIIPLLVFCSFTLSKQILWKKICSIFYGGDCETSLRYEKNVSKFFVPVTFPLWPVHFLCFWRLTISNYLNHCWLWFEDFQRWMSSINSLESALRKQYCWTYSSTKRLEPVSALSSMATQWRREGGARWCGRTGRPPWGGGTGGRPKVF